MPPEIMLKILGYITPDCKKCFLQRDLLKLGLVCKEFKRLAESADFYKEINLIDECCPLPSNEALRAVLKNSGSKLRKIVCDYRCRDLLRIAVEECGDTIEEINVENDDLFSTLEVPAYMMGDISGL